MFRINLFSMEFLVKGINYSGFTVVNGTKFIFSISVIVVVFTFNEVPI